MPIFGDKQITSVTIKINQLSTPHRNDEIDESMELYLSDLLDLIRIQPSSGAAEAARAIRKKVKYGDLVEEQLRALSLLELLILNSGSKIGPVIARDDKLIDVLKGILNGSGRTALGSLYDPKVHKKVKGLALGWKNELDGLDGYKYFASLWKNIKGSSGGHGSSSSARNHRRTESGGNIFDSVEDNQPISSPSRVSLASPRNTPPPRPTAASPYSKSATSSSSTSRRQQHKEKAKDKKKKKRKGNSLYADEQFKIPQINYKVEAPKIRNVIADCHTHTTALQNALLTLSVGTSPLNDEKCSFEFEKCRYIRRKVLRYLQYVGAGNSEDKSSDVVAMDEEFLGSLIHANEQLVQIFKKFDASCGYTEENPAPNYDDEDDDGYESYYTDSTDEEEEAEEEVKPDINERLKNATIQEGSSSKRPPPPRPVKPAGLGTKQLQQPPVPPSLTKHATNDTIGSDPFGDGNTDHSPYD